jgi:hypothetical protein
VYASFSDFRHVVVLLNKSRPHEGYVFFENLLLYIISGTYTSSGAGVASISQFRVSAMLLLQIVGN